MRALVLLAALALAACGADGPPEPVGEEGIGISGTATVGVKASF